MKKALAIVLTAILILLLSTVAYADNDSRAWKSEEVDSGIVPPHIGYMADWEDFYHIVENPTSPDQVYKSLADLLVGEVDNIELSDVAGLSDSQLKNLAHSEGITYYLTEFEGLTDQVWAAQVEANPGESGRLEQEFEAAYGSTEGAFDGDDFWDEEEGYEGPDDGFGFVADDTAADGYTIERGEDYVGNYFTIDQLASTSDGITKRYISISSPWSHAFVEEDMSVVGESEIGESFVMDNIEPGAEVIPDWWDLF